MTALRQIRNVQTPFRVPYIIKIRDEARWFAAGNDLAGEFSENPEHAQVFRSEGEAASMARILPFAVDVIEVTW
jgi:hypothetical protein